MKKAIVLALVLSLAFAGVAMATVVGSWHDLGSSRVSGVQDPGATGTQQVCVFCHHPHRGASSVQSGLLWNLDSWDDTAYTTYTGSVTYNAPNVGVGNPDVDSTVSQSFLCMACHDGTIAAGSLVRAPRDGSDITVGITLMTDNDLIESSAVELQDDHPVNIEYVATLVSVDGGLQAVTTGGGTGSYVQGYMDATNTYPLYGTRLQCATCHDVHAGAGSSKDPIIQFMRGSTVTSEICVDCHTNK